jgi:hypothetical protein
VYVAFGLYPPLVVGPGGRATQLRSSVGSPACGRHVPTGKCQPSRGVAACARARQRLSPSSGCRRLLVWRHLAFSRAVEHARDIRQRHELPDAAPARRDFHRWDRAAVVQEYEIARPPWPLRPALGEPLNGRTSDVAIRYASTAPSFETLAKPSDLVKMAACTSPSPGGKGRQILPPNGRSGHRAYRNERPVWLGLYLLIND